MKTFGSAGEKSIRHFSGQRTQSEVIWSQAKRSACSNERGKVGHKHDAILAAELLHLRKTFAIVERVRNDMDGVRFAFDSGQGPPQVRPVLDLDLVVEQAVAQVRVGSFAGNELALRCTVERVYVFYAR